jgi:site-specific recombinase XerD
MDETDLQGFWKYLSEERQLGERTIASYLTFYRLFNPQSISQDYINEFIILHKNTSVVRAFVQHYLDYQEMSGMFSFPKKILGRKPQRIVRMITRDELERVRDYFYQNSFMNGLLFDLLYQGAMRRIECITIKIGSFFWNEWFEDTSQFCKLLILGKGKKERIVLINPETAQSLVNYFIKEYKIILNDLAIRKFFENYEDNLLFKTKKGKALTEKNVYDIIKKLSKEELKRDIRPHELRHSRATELEKKGVVLRDIKNYLGHSKLATTEIYLHKTGEESLENIKERLINNN